MVSLWEKIFCSSPWYGISLFSGGPDHLGQFSTALRIPRVVLRVFGAGCPLCCREIPGLNKTERFLIPRFWLLRSTTGFYVVLNILRHAFPILVRLDSVYSLSQGRGDLRNSASFHPYYWKTRQALSKGRYSVLWILGQPVPLIAYSILWSLLNRSCRTLPY